MNTIACAKNKDVTPTRLTFILREKWNLNGDMDLTSLHVFREANQEMDFSVKHRVDQDALINL